MFPYPVGRIQSGSNCVGAEETAKENREGNHHQEMSRVQAETKFETKIEGGIIEK